MLKILGILLLSIVLILITLIVFSILFMKFAAVFGGKAPEHKRLEYKKSPNYKNGQFHNLMPMNRVYQAADFMDESIKDRATRQPNFVIPFHQVSADELVYDFKHTRLLWYGHSTFFVQMDRMNILIDPMFSRTPSPIQAIGRSRYSKGLPIAIQDLPTIDAVLITHDHYDHLDYHSILKIKQKVKHFYVPLGISGHLMRWGVAEEAITELDWLDTVALGSIRLTLTPTHHYSGRSLTDRFQTLWGGWILKGNSDNIYLSGDGGYGPHFKKIGEAYGPFDFAMIECGQYSRYWKQNHLFPEQTAQVALDVQAKLVMPIHWGAFTLAMHGWTDSVERFITKANSYYIPTTTPKIGEWLVLDDRAKPASTWWKKI